jgi:hypothetical protein
MMMDSLRIHTANYIADTYPYLRNVLTGLDKKSEGCTDQVSYAVGFYKRCWRLFKR